MTCARAIAILLVAGLAGCGRISDLEPAPGQPLPVKPLMARATPTPAELLTPPSYARPNRVDELVKRSEPRRPDPFDLPPPSGTAGPAQPAGTDPTPIPDETGISTPQ